MKRFSLLFLCVVCLVEESEASGGQDHRRTISESSIEALFDRDGGSPSSRFQSDFDEGWLDDSNFMADANTAFEGGSYDAGASPFVSSGGGFAAPAAVKVQARSDLGLFPGFMTDAGENPFNLKASDFEGLGGSVEGGAPASTGASAERGASASRGASAETAVQQDQAAVGGQDASGLAALIDGFQEFNILRLSDYQQEEEFQKVTRFIGRLEQERDRSGQSAARAAKLNKSIENLKGLRSRICSHLDQINELNEKMQDANGREFDRLEAELQNVEDSIERLEKKVLKIYTASAHKGKRGKKKALQKRGR